MMKQYLLLTLLLIGCSQNGDGPFSAYPSDSTWAGEGFYLSAELDSGRRIHAIHDTLSVTLGSLWLLSPCYLQELYPYTAIQGSDQFMAIRVPLHSNSDIHCPSGSITLDTVVQVAPMSDWNSIERLVIWGADSSRVLPDSGTLQQGPISQDDRFSVPRDSIYLRKGLNQDSLFIWILDSAFADPTQLPGLEGENPWLFRKALAINDSTWTFKTYFIEKYAQCAFYNREKQGSATLYRVEFWRELFVMDSTEQRCLANWSRQKEFMVWDLDSVKAVTDSALVDSILMDAGLWP